MSDVLIRNEAFGAQVFAAHDVSIRLAAPMARYSLRARQPKTLETLLKVKLPAKVTSTKDGIICLGPDEWFMRAADGTNIPMGEGLPISITDVSERSVCYIVEGERAAEILMSGCPLDLDKFEVGRATRTIYETVEIILIREAEDRFHVEVWRSFSTWLWLALTTAASH